MRMRDEMIIKCFWSSLPSFTSGRGEAERLETRRRVMRGSDRPIWSNIMHIAALRNNKDDYNEDDQNETKNSIYSHNHSTR